MKRRQTSKAMNRALRQVEHASSPITLTLQVLPRGIMTKEEPLKSEPEATIAQDGSPRDRIGAYMRTPS